MNAKQASPEIVEEPAAAPVEEAPSDGDQGIGARVTAVFTAAEKAGQHIVTLAREEADDIRREARAEAEAYLRERRLEADQEIERMFAETRRKVEEIEGDAHRAARQVEDDARIRKERLREEVRLIEERISWAKEGLSDVNQRLEEVFLDNEPLPVPDDSTGS